MDRDEAQAAFEAWPYRLGMGVYRASVSAFFAWGGLSRLKKKYKVGLKERMGEFGPDAPQGVLWVHAVSVGEVQSAFPLLMAAKEANGLPRVLSTVTTTGWEMAEKLAVRCVDAMIYNPWDLPRFVNRALDALQPKVYVAMETERWPNMLAALRERNIPAFLANGRLSEESARKLQRQRRFWRGVLCCFERLLVRYEADKEAFLSLGVPEGKIITAGDCKVDAMLARKDLVNAGKWACLRRGKAPLFLAGSTHKGEDETVLDAFGKTRETFPAARLVITPRHPQRASRIATVARAYGKAALLSAQTSDWDVLVVDKIGVLFELYPTVDAAFIGGSLAPKGGQNLMEPALFGIQVTHGPYMSDFPDTARMDKLGASRTVTDAKSLSDAWLEALEPRERERAQRACQKYFDSIGGAARRCWEIIRGRL
ncbi:MAG: 3-deoxy-D-manno-octulosonic acid transferase [Synergistaceae bacterium]|jgi:3-deoxy-D-manno-octulosonic-acid transferase|nr:3-deoxy-D-manno-octulosonic acid transferase [Synergistaceae bacterium]